ncbi:MAG: hypothetical protein KKA41_06230, partial [Proteobacteria bacterium]|nr:hypothetical protein [Pseudomonadota bacterium]
MKHLFKPNGMKKPFSIVFICNYLFLNLRREKEMGLPSEREFVIQEISTQGQGGGMGPFGLLSKGLYP